MRLFNWRRQAVLNAMPLVKPDQVRTPWHEFWRRFRRQHMAMTAALFVILLIVVAIFARWIAPYDAENYFEPYSARTVISRIPSCLAVKCRTPEGI